MNNIHNTIDRDALTRRIMRRIYVVSLLRRAVHPVFLKTLVVFAFIFRSTSYVSYRDVFANAPSLFDIENNLRFFAGAFAHTSTATLYLYLGIIAMTLWIAFDMARRKHSFSD